MIQILGLREFIDKTTGEVRLYDSHFKNNWRVASVKELFANIDQHIQQIPETLRWNLFYTVSTCEEAKGRKFVQQDVLPIDIDGMDTENLEAYIKVVLDVLSLERDKVGIVASGNGLHFLIGLREPITDVSYFKTNRVYYRALCGRINQALYEAGLRGGADPSVFSAARLLRLPLTTNCKKDKKDSLCTLLNGNIEPSDVDLVTLSDLPRLFEGDSVHPNAFKRFPDPDTDAVLDGCSFLKHCKDNQDTVSEPEWYAMMSVVGRLADGDKLVHEFSDKHGAYHPDAVDLKIEHALEASGPRTCDNISSMYDGCKSCPHYNKITSPIQIVGENYVKTIDTGFYNIVIKNGVAVKGKPNYDDLVKYYGQQQPYMTLVGTHETYKYNNTHWEVVDNSLLHSFAESMFKPSPNNSMCKEFEGKIKRRNLKQADFTLAQGKLNFNNGVLDIESMRLGEHNEDQGFTYVIPYNYSSSSDGCPTFDKFMADVTCNDSAICNLLMEYMGYCMSGTDPKLVQKCAVLHGSGSNGKSVLIQLMRELVGPENCSAVGMNNITKETGRYALVNKLFNVTDETPTDAFLASSDFKSIVSGDTVEIRKLYANPMTWKATTKLMFACNELPYTNDFSHGLYRRLIIVPFKNVFSDEKGNLDPHILDKLLVERGAILNKLLLAFKTLKARKYKFEKPAAVLQEMQEYKEMGDTVLRFTNDMCDSQGESAANQISLDMAYRCYIAWSEEIRSKPVKYGTFSRRFGVCVSDVLPRVSKERIRDGNRRVTMYKGMTISANAIQI